MTSAAVRGIKTRSPKALMTQQQKDAEQQDQVQQAAQAIEAPPHPRHDSQWPRSIVPVHISFLQRPLPIQQH